MGSSEPSQRWQQMEATDASHRHIATHNACDAEGNNPGQALHHYVCEAEGDNTSLARHLHYTPAKPRETTLPWPGTTPSRLRSRGTTLARHHTATPPPPTGAPPRLRKFSATSSPSLSSRTSS